MKSKKRMMATVLLSSSILFGSCSPSIDEEKHAVYADELKPRMSNMKVVVDGELLNLSQYPLIKDGVSLVPLRSIFEAMGADVVWNGEERSVYAEKEGKTVKLFIGSKEASVNGEKVTLDLSANLYNDTTYVPLRFVGESLGEAVTWDEVGKIASVYTEKNSHYTFKVVSNVGVRIDGHKLEEELTLINKNNVMLVPAGTITDAVGLNFNYSFENGAISVSNSKLDISMNINSKEAIVNGSPTLLSESPMLFEDVIYIPLRFIGSQLGEFRWNKGSKEIIIDTPSLGFKSTFLNKEAVSIAKPTNVQVVSPTGNRRLMVSNNPETLNSVTFPTDDAVLWADHVQSDKESVDHRILGWHLNNIDKNMTIGITIENLSETNNIVVTNSTEVKRFSDRGWGSYDVGNYLAESALRSDLKETEDISIRKGFTTLYTQFTVNPKNLIGFLNEFAVKKESETGELNYKIRVVATKAIGKYLPLIKDEPVELDKNNSHSRGSWDYSELEAITPAYNVGSGERSFNISNGVTDNFFTAESSNYAEYGTIQNNGHFGVDYTVKIPVQNNTGNAKIVRVRLGARGGIYSGAVKVEDEVKIALQIKPMSEVANVKDFRVEAGQNEIEFKVHHAGGVNLPLAVNVSTVN